MKNQKETTWYILSETLSPIFPSLTLTRRFLLKLAAEALAGAVFAPRKLFGAEQRLTSTPEENLKIYGYPWDEVYTTHEDLKKVGEYSIRQ